MKMIKPSYKIYNIPDATDHDAVLMHLERIGRTCYKSEDRITSDSCIKFIENIRNLKHWAILEHYIFTISVSSQIYFSIVELLSERTIRNPDILMKIGYIRATRWDEADGEYRYLISFSATAINNLIQCPEFKNDPDFGLVDIYMFMCKHYPELMVQSDDIIKPSIIDKNIKFLTRKEIRLLPNWLRDIHDFMSVLFVVDRGITHEIVRHRPASFAQESTRYCNYSKFKFGNEITVIIPSCFDNGMSDDLNTKLFDVWKKSCENSMNDYLKLLEMGATAQEARSVLPTSIKADLIMTANIYEFKHFFNMRCDKPAHPQMREVACPLLIEANESNEYKHLFDDQIHLVNK